MNGPRLLLLTFYYPPDLGAGSFRSHALVQALLERLPANAHLEVLTTAPNRYAGFSTQAPAVEENASGRLTVRRLALPSHQSGMLDQSRAFASYAYQVRRLTHGKGYDLVMATSSRLMTAVLGAYVARQCSARLYLDIRDIFVENLPFLLPPGSRWFGIPFFSALERWAVKRASRVNLVSRGFEAYYRPRFPRQVFSWHSNGVDRLFIDAFAEQAGSRPRAVGAAASRQPRRGRLSILYAGNIGQCQGLERTLPALAKRLENEASFVLIGDGGRRQALEARLRELGTTNVEIRAPVERDRLIEEYHKADVLFLHLNDMACFSRVIPSKLFEYAATGKPILAGVRAFPAEFCARHIANASVFEPCDPEAGESAFRRLSISDQPREEFVDRFRRDRIMSEMAGDIAELVDR
ncbi:glycosyltransferase family 4 protein [Halomonas cerina]|uniref:Glycosyltransferase involved in cell wall biosynthesis n=1 Tax=Halomonas cerina TaxID=447424 RepID=A0A839V976_9GAMM|nr:glycosyltransferase family 4 protein [Halomonas cerina]MBB3192203.1 glycosyltransferase involved in cell wall biosynthesis [Halomonas cerina]